MRSARCRISSKPASPRLHTASAAAARPSARAGFTVEVSVAGVGSQFVVAASFSPKSVGAGSDMKPTLVL